MADVKLFTEGVHSVPIDSVNPYPGNPRRGDVPRIKASLEAFGQYRPIVVQLSTKFIVAGNHTHRAAQELGWSHIEVKFIDVDADTAKRILAADNRTADDAIYDDQELVNLLQSIESLEGTGFQDDDVKALLEQLEQANANERVPSEGSLLSLADISVAEPTYEVKHGDQYRLDRHYMLILDVIKDHARYMPVLAKAEADAGEPGVVLFVPYPGVFVPLTQKADAHVLVMVQPDTYTAGHILDKFKAVRGDSAITYEAHV